MNKIIPVYGKPKHYAWGGMCFIPSFFNLENNDNQPYAEWWLGAHPEQSSLIDDTGKMTSLRQWLKANPSSQSEQERLGDEPLSFLMKVLDVQQMLAIQVHPNKQQAIEGYAKEEKLGIASDCFERSYKDTSHKPEMMVALTPSWLAHGFASEKQIEEVLSLYPSIDPIVKKLKGEGIKAAFEYAMSSKQLVIDGWLTQVIETKSPAYRRGNLAKNQPEYWVCHAFHDYASGYDKGLLALLMMNIVYVPSGKGIFQGAGVPHAYLSGQNIELMANSDNVVRVGPTKLHVDIDEVYRLIDYRYSKPELLSAQQVEGKPGLLCYQQNDCSEFKLSMIHLTSEMKQLNYQSQHLSLLLVTQGGAIIDENGTPITIRKGSSFIIPANSIVDFEVNCFTSNDSKINDFTAFIATFGK